MPDDVSLVREKLKAVEQMHIIFPAYACRRAVFRQVPIEELHDTLLNPGRLVSVERQSFEQEERFNCLFTAGKRRFLRIVLVFEGKEIRVITVIKLRRQWRKQR